MDEATRDILNEVRGHLTRIEEKLESGAYMRTDVFTAQFDGLVQRVGRIESTITWLLRAVGSEALVVTGVMLAAWLI